MKRTAWLALTIILIVLGGCSNPFMPSSEEGVLSTGRISIVLNGSSARTLLPDLALDTAYYEISGSSTGGTAFGPVTFSESTYTIDNLAVGSWTLTVDAFNSEDFQLGTGSGSGIVESGNNTSVAITINPLTADGGMDITVLWPEGGLDSPSLDAVLIPPGGTPEDIYSVREENRASYLSENMAVGFHRLFITVFEGAFKHTFMESVKVVSGYTTTAVLEITEDMLIEDKVPAPVAEPAAGTYGEAQTITLTCADDEAEIYYSLNGSIPDAGHGILYTEPVTINTGATLMSAAVSTAGISSEVLISEYTITGTIARPTLDVSQGLYFEPVDVRLSCSTDVTTVIYTLDGSVPVVGSSPTYSGAIRISADTTLKAVAFDSTIPSNTSEVMTAEYRITDYADPPLFSLEGGTYNFEQSLTLSTGDPEAGIIYTLDGTTPSASNGLPYTAAIPINKTMSVKAVCLKSDWGNSDVLSRSYTMKVAAPEFLTTPGNYLNSEIPVQFSTDTPGADIYYTLDGTEPAILTGTMGTGVTITEAKTIRILGTRSGWEDSVIVEAAYTPSSTTDIVTPVDGAVIVSSQPLLEWNVLDAVYHLQLSESALFSGELVVNDDTLTDSHYQFAEPLVNGSEYHWQIRYFRDSAWSDWFGPFSFTVDFDGTINLDSDLKNPVGITFSGGRSFIQKGTEMTVTAETSEPVDSYAWFLNGTLLSEYTGTSAVVGADLDYEVYRLTLFVEKSGILSSKHIDFKVGDIVPPTDDSFTRTGTAAVLNTGPSGSWDDDNVNTTSVLYEDGIYKMWYTGSDGSYSRIGYATSEDGETWTKYASNPVVNLGSNGSHDDRHAYKPCVVHAEGVYHMWYSGYDDYNYRIMYATSPDGMEWTKYSSSAVLGLGSSGAWDDTHIYGNSVIYMDGLFHMWFSGHDGSYMRIGYATSSDGTAWTKHESNPVINLGTSGAWDDYHAFYPNVLYINGTYHMWYTGYDGSYGRIGYAQSEDGFTWVKSGNNPVLNLGAGGTWDDARLYDSNVVFVDNQYEMYYSGYDGGTWRIGRAVLVP